jgi:phosphatidate phosphatase APP1
MLHRAARVENVVHEKVERQLRLRGWQVSIVPYTGYGTHGWVRVLARVLLRRPGRAPRSGSVRGWRSFTTFPVQEARVVIDAGGIRVDAVADRGGFVDAVVEADLEPGWRTVRIAPWEAPGAGVEAPVRVVGSEVTFGIVSDIDDTVMVTALPRPLLAAWNTFVLDEHARAPVPGMAVLYERLINAHPGAPVLYLSTGAWNVAPALGRFLSRHLYPPGPLLLTDWGPTTDRWFRSGQEHKRSTLERLAREFPQIRWLLIGDDGQHDQQIYARFVTRHPEQVAGVAIRHLSPTEAVLSRGLPAPALPGAREGSARETWLSAPDGAGLAQLMGQAGLL